MINVPKVLVELFFISVSHLIHNFFIAQMTVCQQPCRLPDPLFFDIFGQTDAALLLKDPAQIGSIIKSMLCNLLQRQFFKTPGINIRQTVRCNAADAPLRCTADLDTF